MTSYSTLVFVPDPASTAGKGKTGLVASAVTVSYTRVETDNDVIVTDVTSSMNALSALTDAFNAWGWLEVSATVAPGLYRIDIADAVFATGAWTAVVQVQITSGLAGASPMEFVLVDGTVEDIFALVDTEVAAIKAKTDQLTFTTSNKVDATIQAAGDFVQAAADKAWSTAARTLTAATNITSTGGTTFTQTGDSFVRLGAAGAGLTAIGDTRIANLDATISSRTKPADTQAAVTLVTTTTNLTNAPTSGDLTATMKTSVKTQVTDGLNVDTYAEPGQENPAATTTLVKKIGYLYKFLRNRVTQTSSTLSVYADDATTVDQKSTVSDNGTTYDRSEIGTGP